MKISQLTSKTRGLALLIAAILVGFVSIVYPVRAKVNFEDLTEVMHSKKQLFGDLAWKAVTPPNTAAFTHTIDLLYPQGYWQLSKTKDVPNPSIAQTIQHSIKEGTPVTFVFYANPQNVQNAQMRIALKKVKAPNEILWSQIVKLDSDDSGWRDHYYRYSFPAPEIKANEVQFSVGLEPPTARSQFGASWFYVIGDKDPLFEAAAKTDENIVRVKARNALKDDEIDKRIDRFRKGKLVVSVVDQNGAPIAGASVKMRLQRSPFAFACQLRPNQITEAGFAQSKSAKAIQSLFNTVLLEADWAAIEKSKGNFDFSELDKSVAWIKQSGMTPIVALWTPSQKPPGWLSTAKSGTGNALRSYVSKLISHLNSQVDMFQYSLDQSKGIGAWVDQSTPRAAAEKLTAWAHLAGAAEKTKLILRIDDVGKIKWLFDQLSRSGTVPNALSTAVVLVDPNENEQDDWLALEELRPLATDLYLAGWVDAKNNDQLNEREIALLHKTCRAIFSHPSAQGIVFPNPLDDAVLCSTAGTTTALNKELTNLIRGKWSGIFAAETDQTGKVETRNFYGDYEITVDDHKGHTTKSTYTLSFAQPGTRNTTITLKR